MASRKVSQLCLLKAMPALGLPLLMAPSPEGEGEHVNCPPWLWRKPGNVFPSVFRHIPFPQHHGESCGTGLTSDKVVLCEAAGKEAGMEEIKSCGEIDIQYMHLCYDLAQFFSLF